MKKLITVVMVCLCISSNAQLILAKANPEKNKENTSQIEQMQGSGNCTYANNLRSMVKLMSKRHSLNEFQNSLCKWELRVDDSRKSMEYDSATDAFDKPFYRLQYSSIKKTDLFDVVTIEYHSEDNIESVGFEMHEYKVEDIIAPQLSALGFVYDKHSSRLYNALDRADRNFVYRNNNQKLIVQIRFLGYKQYFIEMRSLK